MGATPAASRWATQGFGPGPQGPDPYALGNNSHFFSHPPGQPPSVGSSVAGDDADGAAPTGTFS